MNSGRLQAIPFELFILFTAVILGVAAQNIIIATSLVGFLWRAYSGAFAGSRLPVSAKRQSLMMAIFLALITLATLLNPAMPTGKNLLRLWMGHLGILFLPLMVPGFLAVASEPVRQKLVRYWGVLWFAFAGLAYLQFSLGWRFEGTHIVASFPRASGFFSHPMTLAYVALAWLALAALRLFKEWRWQDGLLFFGVFICVITSGSRVVMALGILWLVFAAFGQLRGFRRLQFLAAAFLILAASVLGNRHLQSRMAEVGSGPTDRQTHYADDRLAFWHAHLLMAEERPLIGHGVPQTRDYRAPYYEKIGLGFLEKKYEAHNTFLQVLVEAGVLGLSVFLVWWFWPVLWLWRHKRWEMVWPVASVTFLLTLASLTQNSFQDSEVRYSMALLLGLLWWRASLDANHQGSKSP